MALVSLSRPLPVALLFCCFLATVVASGSEVLARDVLSILQSPQQVLPADGSGVGQTEFIEGRSNSDNRHTLRTTRTFNTADASKHPPVAFDLHSRVYVPFSAGEGLGYGMGAAEQVSYDVKERYMYVLSEQGALNVVDYMNASAPVVVKELSVSLGGYGTPTDVEVCGNMVFVSLAASDVVSDGCVLILSAVSRADPSTPAKRAVVLVGPNPDHILPNAACSMLAVANEGEGRYDDINGLCDPEGSVDIISNLHSKSPKVHRVPLNLGEDKDLLKKGAHLPLPLGAMEYWQDYSGVDVNFSRARAKYTTAMNLEPEYLAWSSDGTQLFVSLQENNALVTITKSNSAWQVSGIDALGLKDWSNAGGTKGLDLVQDGACVLKNYDCFSSLRQADSIAAVSIDGQDFILTANEGDDKSYGDFDELLKKDEVMNENGEVLLPNMVATQRVVDAHMKMLSKGAEPDTRISVGSTAVDFSDPKKPVLRHLTSHGARGISIYKKTPDALKLVWDSGSDFEREQCKAFPWAHNGIQDEEFAPIFGVLYNTTSDEGLKETIEENNDPDVNGCSDGGDGKPGACPLGQTVDERSPKDGAASESIVAGVACGRLLAVATTEKQSSIFVYDLTSVSCPVLLFVKHLSPASETSNPGVAYNGRELGEIDPESAIFVEAEHSPSGKAGVFFAGAWSGTVSFWEFTCAE